MHVGVQLIVKCEHLFDAVFSLGYCETCMRTVLKTYSKTYVLRTHYAHLSSAPSKTCLKLSVSGYVVRDSGMDFFSDFGTEYKYPDFLTCLLTYV